MLKTCYNSLAVIGIGFGDEGKGSVVDSLVDSNTIVVRYSGGQQAGHTVSYKGLSHVFSNFGSGTLRGAPTYWSKYCTFDPVGAIREYEILKEKGITPILYLDRKSPVTTPYDKLFNQSSIDGRFVHGTCGVGVGDTLEREEKHYSLLVEDLEHESVFKIKLELIAKMYYRNLLPIEEISHFLECCSLVRKLFFIKSNLDCEALEKKTVIFEGSQGLLLDQNFGFFPHVARSNVGTKNILEMGFLPQVQLVTRAYQTRHGHGPMTNQNIPHNIKSNPYETNVRNRYQGEFRISLLDLDLLKYGIDKDDYLRTTSNKDLVITCLDLVADEYRYTIKGEIVGHTNAKDFCRGIADYLGIEKVLGLNYRGCVYGRG